MEEAVEGCASRLFAVRTEQQALGAMASAAQEPWAMGGAVHPSPPTGAAEVLGAAQQPLLLLRGPLLSLLASLLFCGWTIPHSENHHPSKEPRLGTLFCHWPPEPRAGSATGMDRGWGHGAMVHRSMARWRQAPG